MKAKKQNSDEKIKAFRLNNEDFELLNKLISDYKLTDKAFIHSIIHNKLQHNLTTKEELNFRQNDELIKAIKSLSNNQNRTLLEQEQKHFIKLESLLKEIGKLEGELEKLQNSRELILSEANKRIDILNDSIEDAEKDKRQLYQLLVSNKDQRKAAQTWLELKTENQKLMNHIEKQDEFIGQLQTQIAEQITNNNNKGE